MKDVKTIAITGASGYIGRHLISRFLKEDNVRIVALVRNVNKDIPEVDNNRIVKVKYDMSDLSNLLQLDKYNIDVIYNLAWTGVYNRKDRGSIDSQMNNVYSSLELLEISNKIGIKTFINIGSIMEKELDHLIKNGEPIHQGMIYAAAKAHSRNILSIMADNLRITFITATVTNTFGPGEKSGRLLSDIFDVIRNHGTKSLSSCEQLYDFIYIDDLVEALYQVALRGKHRKDYLLGSNHPKPLKDFILKVKEVLDPENKSTIDFDNTSFINASLSQEDFNMSNYIEDIGSIPRSNFSEAIKKSYYA